PAVAGDVISVASSLSGGDTLGVLVSGDVNDTFEAVEGTGAVRLSDGSVTGDLMAPSDPANVFGCDPVADDLTGKVALISRGACSFDLKFINAQAAGAAAILVYNDGANADRIAPIVMGGVGASGTPITIPGVMTTAFAGFELSSALEDSGSISSTLDESIVAATVFGDTISGFSSQGPGHGGSTFKPDVTGPGSAIASTLVGSGTGPLTISGTSMSSPHVAGLAALLRQAHPGLRPTGIKAIIQNSAVTAAGAGTVGPTPALSRQGTGVVRADSAIGLSSYAAPGGVSFGRINPSKSKSKKFKESFRIHDLSGGSRHFTGTHVPNQTFPGVEVSCPSSANTRRGKSDKLRIKLTMDPTVGPFDDAFHSQTEVDGWCVFDDGVDTLRVGYLAVVDPASEMKAKGKGSVVKIENKNGNVGWAEGFTLTGRGGLVLDKTTNSFNAVGVRTNSFAAFGDLVEFGISTDRTWESMAVYEIDIFVDVNADGIDDFILVAADFFGDGIPITAIFPQGRALFDVGQDFNDASAILTFFGKTDAPLGFLGFLPAGDTDFDYTAVFFDLRNGSFDVQVGSVDLADEIVPAFNSFGLPAGVEVDVPVSGSGQMLWLFQNNEAKKREGKHQAKIVKVSAKRKGKR
ncbi:MAG: S8 family serine peptidase, partial [Gammaproteobacteria bacterium]|nr:S8 family serine peptidase [Gammaproteobacteria bacterium]